MDTFLGSVSNPVTLWPASAKRRPKGRPTYPHPMMPTLSWVPLKNSGFRSIAMSCVELLEYFLGAQQAERPVTHEQFNIAGLRTSARKRSREFPCQQSAEALGLLS